MLGMQFSLASTLTARRSKARDIQEHRNTLHRQLIYLSRILSERWGGFSMEELLIMLQRARHRPIPNQDRLCQAITTTLFALYSRMPHHIKYVSQFFNHLSHSNSPRAYYNLQKHVGNSGNSRVLKSVERTFDLQQRRCYPLEGGQKETSCKNVQKRTKQSSFNRASPLATSIISTSFVCFFLLKAALTFFRVF